MIALNLIDFVFVSPRDYTVILLKLLTDRCSDDGLSSAPSTAKATKVANLRNS